MKNFLKLKLLLVNFTFKVTFSSSSPDVVKILLVNDAVDPVLLLDTLNADAVHAELPAVVPGPLPVPLGVLTNC